MWYPGVPRISMVPMARNTENPRFFKDGCWNKVHSPANFSRFSWICGSPPIFDILLPNSAYKICHLHWAAGGSRASLHFNGSDGEKYGKSKVFQGWLLEQGVFIGKFNDFGGFTGLH